MRTLYIQPRLAALLPRRCCVVVVPPLLRQLILHTMALGMLRRDVPEHRRLVAFLLDQVRGLPAAPLELPMPRDERALRVATRLRDSPGTASTLTQVGREAGASRRTLERLFLKETGMSLGRWRQQARLLHAMRLLARGQGVTAAALEVGHESVSAFIGAFSGALGTTPGRYYRVETGMEPVSVALPRRHSRSATRRGSGGRDAARRCAESSAARAALTGSTRSAIAGQECSCRRSRS